MTSTPILLTVNIGIASLNPSFAVDDVAVTFSGWGSTNFEDDPTTLHMINTRTISNEECILEESVNAWRITDKKICTVVDNRTGICYGDEGGALISNNAVIGVASFHSHCAVNLPSIYERIAHHRVWIRSHIS